MRPSTLPRTLSLLGRAAALFVPLALATSAAAAPPAPLSEAAQIRADIKKGFGFVPGFIERVPDATLPGAWQAFAALEIAETTALPCKVKELIGLAVASQIPCRYCIYSHTAFAKAMGASDGEIGEAVTMAALARQWSTWFNGIDLDPVRYEADVKRLVDAAKSAPAPSGPMPAPSPVLTAAAAKAEMQAMFGFVPDFITRFPADALPGAWRELRDVELSPGTNLPEKVKSLVSLAVAAQIPCHYCVVSDTAFARLAGATDQEIGEAVAMGGLVRHWSTLLNGLQVDEAGYKKDIDRLVAGMKKMADARAH